MVFMDMSAIILGPLSSSTFSTIASGVSSESPKTTTGSSAPITIDPSEVRTNNTDAKLDKIKEEIKKMAVLPSSDEIVSKYGITKAQAQQVLAEVCMEIATDAGGTPEQVAQMASDMYMMAEMSDAEPFKTFDASEILKGAFAQDQANDEKALSAEEVSEKYGITLEQAQTILDVMKKNDEDSAYCATAYDLSAEPTYSINNSGDGQFNISLNSCSFALSTVAYSA